MLRFHNYDIVFQEIPDEVTLAINITHCPNGCEGCHSPHLQQDVGEELTTLVIDALLAKYGDDITCFCFMGGDRDVIELERLATYVRQHSDLKIGWYSGRNEMPPHPELFDFVKLGPYMADKGSLKSRTTNQRLYRRNGNEWEDITARFWK
jgi:anaerobic ribonucleoside-triphosphate reductase activating protein